MCFPPIRRAETTYKIKLLNILRRQLDAILSTTRNKVIRFLNTKINIFNDGCKEDLWQFSRMFAWLYIYKEIL